MKQELISTVEFQKKTNPKGYILINYNGEWILEHKFVCECKINRKLTKEEVVHHISGNRKDNREINLMIFKSQKEHKSFENKVKQLGWTQPLINRVNLRWEKFYKDGTEI